MTFPTSSKEGWTRVGEHNGVRLFSRGSGRPVLIFSGLEGSGESCLHLALPTIEAPPQNGAAQRSLLVDYAAEEHTTFEALVESAHTLVRGEIQNTPCALWCQSFGNLLGTAVVARGGLDVERIVLVSPFTRLPAWKTGQILTAVRLTPEALYTPFTGLVGEWMFGPSGGNHSHPFFASLKALTPPTLARRAKWLRGKNFAQLFRQLEAPRRAFLGTHDNLVDREEQELFFASLAPAIGLERIEGSGHVVLPPKVIDTARAQLRRWFWGDEA